MTSPDAPLGRRTVLAGLAGTATVIVAGCGSSAKTTTAPTTASTSSSAPGGSPSDAASASAPAAGGGPLATVADIPVGTAVSAQGADGAPIVITRTGTATVAAYSAKCTHMGCTVKPAGKVFACPCHGSKYDAATGKVLNGPAQLPLPPVAVKVAGGKVELA